MLEYKKENCSSCGLCEKVCPFGAIKIQEGFPYIDDNCTECGICAEKCPANAFCVEGEPLNKVTLELLSTARKLADQKKEKVTLLIKGLQERED